MSNVNIGRDVENFGANTNVYASVVEMVVNAIQAIDEARRKDGKVSIRAQLSGQAELDGSLPESARSDRSSSVCNSTPSPNFAPRIAPRGLGTLLQWVSSIKKLFIVNGVMFGNSNLRAAHLGPGYSRLNSGVTLA